MKLQTSSTKSISYNMSQALVDSANTSTRPASPLLSLILLIAAIIALLLHGPIAQLPDYHHFADQRFWLGLPNAADVLSNLGFAVVGITGMVLLWRRRDLASLKAGWSGYQLFFLSLLLTAFGSSWYHLAPDNARLVFDRLPIALACGGLMAAVWHETVSKTRWLTLVLAVFAIASVLWWRYTDLQGVDDLRPYLLLQVMPLVLIPLLQFQARRPSTERLAFGAAIGLYVVAKLCEVGDHALLEMGGVLSGHTLKHMFASVAAGLVAWQLWRRQ